MSDWEVQRNDRSSGRICYEIVETATGVRIAETDDDLNPAAKEHAALIVHAVSCHEELVSAIADYVGLIESFASIEDDPKAHHLSLALNNRRGDNLKRALAKARVEERPHFCQSCGRPEEECSRNPCRDVLTAREA